MNTSIIIGVVISLLVAAGVIATAIILDTSTDAASTTAIDYMQFYLDNKGSNDKFEVVDVYMRPDNTFIQGLYYDP